MNQTGIIAIVPAAGIGSRMQASKAKQYLEINGTSIIETTINALLSHPKIKGVVVVLHAQDSTFFKLAISQSDSVHTCIGGAERVDSVLAGLHYCHQQLPIDDNDWVLVHDAARPCIAHEQIDRLLEQKGKCQAAILAIPCADTLKLAKTPPILHEHASVIEKTVDRSRIWQAQTPQYAPLLTLIDAIERHGSNEQITDEASALEYSGVEVMLVEGVSSNIKITRPSDLALAHFYLSS